MSRNDTFNFSLTETGNLAALIIILLVHKLPEMSHFELYVANLSDFYINELSNSAISWNRFLIKNSW